MGRTWIFFIIIFLFLGITGLLTWVSLRETNTPPADRIRGSEGKPLDEILAPPRLSWSMKLVNETVTDKELDLLADLGITVLSGEWGMDEAEPGDLTRLLDRVYARKMQFIVNFSDGAAWGYAEDGSDAPDERPVWQGERVERYIAAIKAHPAIYGYDISNEAGENLPNGDRFRITLGQMRTAAETVRAIDPNRPIIIRMHYWDNEDGDFTWENPFGAGITNIVMLNLYSNYSEDRVHPVLPRMVEESGQVLVDKVRNVDPKVRVWISLAAFQELPLFVRPRPEDLVRDIAATRRLSGIENIGFFGLGPERYPQEGPGWYLLRDGKDLLEVIRQEIAKAAGAVRGEGASP